MDEKTIKSIQQDKAIWEALKKDLRVELLLDKSGNLIAQTIQRKRLKS